MTGDDHGEQRNGRAGSTSTRGQSGRVLGRRLGVRPRHLVHLPEHADHAPRRPPAYVVERLRDRRRTIDAPDCARLHARIARRQTTPTSSPLSPPRSRALPAPRTNRTHCIVWSDYDTQPQVALAHGIRFDTNYYYWPARWVNDVPGCSPARACRCASRRRTARLIDVYQATTQMTDESGQTLSASRSTRCWTGRLGLRAITAHSSRTCTRTPPCTPGSEAIVSSAQARGVPIVSAKQMLDWLDGRNSSSFGSFSWSGNTLGFTHLGWYGRPRPPGPSPDRLRDRYADGHHPRRYARVLHDADDQGRVVRVLCRHGR